MGGERHGDGDGEVIGDGGRVHDDRDYEAMGGRSVGQAGVVMATQCLLHGGAVAMGTARRAAW